MYSIHHYNKKLKKYASENRNSMTKSEACLWKYALSRKQMLGYTFKRQRPIQNYIADFVCLDLKLIIEVDGYSHDDDSIKDHKRDQDLLKLGFTTLRFSSITILQHMIEVIEIIAEWITQNKNEEMQAD